MAKKNKLWFSGEDAQLAARFTKCLTKALYNRRVSYLRAKADEAANEISIEECPEEVDKMYMPTTKPVEEIIESKLMWEIIRKYLHKLTKNTQFIVITHRRGTMAAADRLYGITMQEKGVSTLVSVDLIEDQLDDKPAKQE